MDQVTDLNTARQTLGGAATNNTSGIAFVDGDTSGSPSYVSATRIIYGAGADIWSSRQLVKLTQVEEDLLGVGADNEAALAFGGYAQGGNTETESYNGSSWTELSGDLNTGRGNLAGVGTEYTAVLAVGGIDNPGTRRDNNESWNGTSWTELTGDLNTARDRLAGGGSSTSALLSGGETPAPAIANITESWNGSAWTEVADLNTARDLAGGMGTSNSSSLAFGGGNTIILQIQKPGMEHLGLK